jgi:hypothetical protein
MLVIAQPTWIWPVGGAPLEVAAGAKMNRSSRMEFFMAKACTILGLASE